MEQVNPDCLGGKEMSVTQDSKDDTTPSTPHSNVF